MVSGANRFLPLFLLEFIRVESYRTAALDETTYQANLNVWKYVKLNGFSFRDVSNMNLK